MSLGSDNDPKYQHPFIKPHKRPSNNHARHRTFDAAADSWTLGRSPEDYIRTAKNVGKAVLERIEQAVGNLTELARGSRFGKAMLNIAAPNSEPAVIYDLEVERQARRQEAEIMENEEIIT